MLTNTGTYALRAVLYLAQRQDEGPVTVDAVAEALGVPKNYLSKVLHALVKDGTLRSLRGPTGGFQLAVDPSSTPLGRILEPFETVAERRGCLLGEGACSDTDPCALHDRWRHVATEVAAFFRDTAVADVIEDETRRKAILGH